MSQQVSFWQRVGHVLRVGLTGRSQGNGNGAMVMPAGETVDPRVQPAPTQQPPPEAATSRLPTRWFRREPSVAQMRNGYQRVLEMMDALQDHFRKQDQRTEQLAQSVDRTVGFLEQLANTQSAQQEHIRSIADNVSEAGKHAAAMSASLSQMPRSLQLQADAVRTMLRQIEVSQEADTQLMHSLQQLSGAVQGLNASSTAQVQTLERLDSANREQKESLTLLVRQQGRRFVITILVAALLGLGALAALLVTLALQLR